MALWHSADMMPNPELSRLHDQFQVILKFVDRRGSNSTLVIVNTLNGVWTKPDRGKGSIRGWDR